MATPFVENLYAGYRTGAHLGKTYARRKAGEAMADLAAYDPSQGMQPQQGWTPEGEAVPTGDEKLPSTRDWIDLRAEALRAAGATGDLDAVAEAHKQIDDLQRRGFTENLTTARELIAQGRPGEAARYLERGASYHPDFGVLLTSPARLQDGSEQLVGYYSDEQTGEPRSPAMVVTPDVIDNYIRLAQDPIAWEQTAWDRKMAEDKAQLDRSRFALDYAEAVEAAKPKQIVHKPQDYEDAAQAFVEEWDNEFAQGGSYLPPELRTMIKQKVHAARNREALKHLDPYELAHIIGTKVLEREGLLPTGGA